MLSSSVVSFVTTLVACVATVGARMCLQIIAVKCEWAGFARRKRAFQVFNALMGAHWARYKRDKGIFNGKIAFPECARYRKCDIAGFFLDEGHAASRFFN